MNNNCELCGGKYDFRMTQIGRFDDMAVISLSGSVFQIDNDNRFYYCPKCGRKLTKENFKGTDFGNMDQDKPDMREKIKEYIGELDTEIKRCDSELILINSSHTQSCEPKNPQVGEIWISHSDNEYELQSRINTLIEVKNDLLGRLEEVI